MLIKRSTPLLDDLVQWNSDERGRTIYQDDSIINSEDGWFYGDNKGNELRTIQPGRGYNFTGVEFVRGISVNTDSDNEFRITLDYMKISNATICRVCGLGNGGWGGIILMFTSTNKLQLYVADDIGDNIYNGINAYTDTTAWLNIEIKNNTTDGLIVLINEIEEIALAYRTFDVQYYQGFLDIGTNQYASTLYKEGSKKIANVKYYDSSGLVSQYNSDESAGLISYDATGNGNHGAITLGGSSESSFHITDNGVPSVQNELGYGKSGWMYDNFSYGEIDRNVGLELSNIEFEFLVNIDTTVTNVRLFGMDNTNTDGFLVQTVNTNQIQIYVAGIAAQTATVIGNRIWHKIKLKYYNGNAYLFVDDVQEATLARALTYNGDYGILIGALAWNSIVYDQGNAEFRYFKVNELDVSGNFVNELVNLDFTNGNETLVPNTGVDAITDTDMNWVGTSLYELIPVDQSTLTQDVLGNTLPATHIGQVRYDSQIKANSVANFDGVLYGTLENSFDTYDVDNLNFKAGFTKTESGGNYALLNYRCRRYVTNDPNTAGFLILYTDTLLRFLYSPLTTNPQVIHDWSYSFVVGQSYDIEIERDGSDITAWINGISLGTQTFIDDIDWINGEPTYIGAWQYRTDPIGITSPHKIHYIVLDNITTGDELININFSEVNGLLWYNIAADRPANSNAIVELNGSSDGTQWGTSDLQYPKNLVEGFNKAGYFDGVRYLSNQNNGFQVDNYEVNIIFDIKGYTGQYDPLTSFCSNLSNVDNHIQRFNNAIRIFVSGATKITIETVVNGYNTLKVKKYGVNLEVTLNGVLETWNDVSATITYTVDTNDIGFLQSWAENLSGIMFLTTFHELDVSGNIVNELMNLDWNNGNETLVPNIGEDVSTDSDMTWVTDSAYTLIPADPSNLTLDINGNELQLKGNNAILPAESIFDRNYADAPELVAAGIAQEDISYDNIIEDKSRFYDSSVNNAVSSMLVYSDFVEPIAGSAGDTDGNLYANLGNHSEFSIQNFEMSVEFFITDTPDVNWQYYFCINAILDSGTRSGMYIARTNARNIKVLAGDGAGTKVIEYVSPIEVSNQSRFKVVFKGFNGNYNVKIFENGIEADDASGTYSTIGFSGTTRILDRSDLAGSAVNETDIFNINYYELNISGNRIKELINLPFSEENGLAWYNIAPDRPVDSDASIVLGGSSDGAQWALLENKDYHHNMQYGYKQEIIILNNNYGILRENDTSSDFDISAGFYCEFKVKLNVDNGNSQTILAYNFRTDDTIVAGFEINYNSAIDKFHVVYARSIASQSSVIIGPTVSTGIWYTCKLWKAPTSKDYHFEINGSETSHTAGYAEIEENTNAKHTVVGAQYNIDSAVWNFFADISIEYLRLWKMNDSFVNQEQFIDLDFINGTVTEVKNEGTDAPSNSNLVYDQNVSTPKIPGDPSTANLAPPLDILGNEITNYDQYIKYNRIKNYLKR